MEEGFDYLRCPMCGGGLIFSEGTHDLSCSSNPRERANRDGDARRGEGGRAALRESGARYGGGRNTGRLKVLPPDPGGEGEDAPGSVPYEFRPRAASGEGGAPQARPRPCEFAVSFTGSSGEGTLWSMRTVHGRTNYFSLIRLMQMIEKREENGELLAPSVPSLPSRPERTPVMKLAFKYGLEEEDIFSIRYSSESVKRLAVFYGLTERDIRLIKAAETGE